MASYLAEFLLKKDMKYMGLIRRHSIQATNKIDAHIIASPYNNVQILSH